MVRGLFCLLVKVFANLRTEAVTVPRTSILGGVSSKTLQKMKSSTQKQLQKLLDHIQSSYAGDYAAVSRDLDKAIYCLHFLKKNQIAHDEVQDLCFALHQLSECFYRMHSKRRIRQHRELLHILDILKSPLDSSPPSP